MPTTVPVGTYTLYAEIDSDDALAEIDEGNNIAVYNRQITVLDDDCGCDTSAGPRSLVGWPLLCLVLAARRRR